MAYMYVYGVQWCERKRQICIEIWKLWDYWLGKFIFRFVQILTPSSMICSKLCGYFLNNSNEYTIICWLTCTVLTAYYRNRLKVSVNRANERSELHQQVNRTNALSWKWMIICKNADNGFFENFRLVLGNSTTKISNFKPVLNDVWDEKSPKIHSLAFERDNLCLEISWIGHKNKQQRRHLWLFLFRLHDFSVYSSLIVTRRMSLANKSQLHVISLCSIDRVCDEFW